MGSGQETRKGPVRRGKEALQGGKRVGRVTGHTWEWKTGRKSVSEDMGWGREGGWGGGAGGGARGAERRVTQTCIEKP